MSSAAQILVRQRDNFPPPRHGRDPEIERTIYLYKEIEGTADQVSRLINSAYFNSITPIVRNYDVLGTPIKEDYSKNANQADYVASFICAAMAGQIVPRHDHCLYDNIEDLYIVDVGNEENKETQVVRPVWLISQYRANMQFRKQPTLENMTKVVYEMGLADFLKLYK